MSNLKAKPYPHLGNNIRIARLMRNYTQAFMADQLKISKSRYSQLEQGRDINTCYLFQIVAILDINIHTFLHVDFSNAFEKAIASSPADLQNIKIDLFQK